MVILIPFYLMILLDWATGSTNKSAWRNLQELPQSKRLTAVNGGHVQTHTQLYIYMMYMYTCAHIFPGHTDILHICNDIYIYMKYDTI